MEGKEKKLVRIGTIRNAEEFTGNWEEDLIEVYVEKAEEARINLIWKVN
jgi:hypothetical protein